MQGLEITVHEGRERKKLAFPVGTDMVVTWERLCGAKSCPCVLGEQQHTRARMLQEEKRKKVI